MLIIPCVVQSRFLSHPAISYNYAILPIASIVEIIFFTNLHANVLLWKESLLQFFRAKKTCQSVLVLRKSEVHEGLPWCEAILKIESKRRF